MLVAASIGWMWINPRLFEKPTTTDNWASKAVLGERVWMERATVPIPARYRVAPIVLNGLAATAFCVALWGLARLSPRPTPLGAGATVAFKMWFLHYMVALFDDMKDATLEYRSWLY